MTKFLDKLPDEDTHVKNSLEAIKSRLQTKILIIIPAIDLIELISARGNTSLSSTLELTKNLKKDIDEFEQKVEEIYDNVLRSNGSSKEKQKRQQAAQQVESFIKDLLFRIEEAIPLISLALTTSGANLSSSLPNSVSPGRLLQAGNHLANADQKFESTAVKTKQIKVKIGPAFTLVLYTIFYGTARGNLASNGDITWKEEHAKCKVQLWRVPAMAPQLYKYELEIHEDLSDKRYHDEDEINQGGRVRFIDVSLITRLFFSASGKLLEIEESKTPVLVLKLNYIFQNGIEEHELDQEIEWLAFEQYKVEEEEEQEDEEEEDIEEYSDEDESDQERGESVIKSLDSLNKGIEQLNLGDQRQESKASLSVLEYLIRLAALQSNDQASVHDISDERIALYLRDDNSTTTSNSDHHRNARSQSSPISPRDSPSSHRRQVSRRVSATITTKSPLGIKSKLRSASSSPYTPSHNSIYNPKMRATPLSKKPQTQSPSSSSTLQLTPWEKDRLNRHPLLRNVIDGYGGDSPLKRRSEPKNH